MVRAKHMGERDLAWFLHKRLTNEFTAAKGRFGNGFVSRLGYHLPVIISYAKQLKSDCLRESPVQQLTQGSLVETSSEKIVPTIVPPVSKERSPVSAVAEIAAGQTLVSLS